MSGFFVTDDDEARWSALARTAPAQPRQAGLFDGAVDWPFPAVERGALKSYTATDRALRSPAGRQMTVDLLDSPMSAFGGEFATEAEFGKVIGGALSPRKTGVEDALGEEGVKDLLTESGLERKAYEAEEAARRARILALAPDPRRVGAVGQALSGLIEFATEGVIGGAVLGPGVGAPTMWLGSTFADTGATLREAGVAPKTADEAAAIDATFAAAQGLLPASLPLKAAGRFAQIGLRAGAGAGINVVAGGAQRGSVGAYLRSQGYEYAAERYRLNDGVGILSDAILGAAFGGLKGAITPLRKREPAPVEDGVPPLGEFPTAEAFLEQARQFATDVEPDFEKAYAYALVAKELGSKDADETLAKLREEYDDPTVLEAGGRAQASSIIDGLNKEFGYDPTPERVRAALDVKNAKHRDIDTAPGIPINGEGKRQHAQALRAAFDQLAEEDGQVNVEGAVDDANFLGRSGYTEDDVDAIAAEIEYAAEVSRRAARATATPLKNFIVKEGGVKDDRGDLEAIVGARSGGDAWGIFNKTNGKSLDDLALKAWERGLYGLGTLDRPSINDFLNALDDELRGLGGDLDSLDAENANAVLAQWEQAGVETGLRGEHLRASIRRSNRYERDHEAAMSGIADALRADGVDEDAAAEIVRALSDAETEMLARRMGVALDDEGDLMFSMGRDIGFEPRDLVLMYNDGATDLEIGVELGYAKRAERRGVNIAHAVAAQLSDARGLVRAALGDPAALKALAEEWRVDEAELRAFVEAADRPGGSRRAASLSKEARRLIAKGVKDRADLTDALAGWSEDGRRAPASRRVANAIAGRVLREQGLLSPESQRGVTPSSADVDQFKKLRAEGASWREIARETGGRFSHITVRNYVLGLRGARGAAPDDLLFSMGEAIPADREVVRDYMIARADGMGDTDLAVEFDIQKNAVTQIMARARRQVRQMQGEGKSPEEIAAHWNVTPDVIDALMEIRTAAGPAEVRNQVLRLAQRQPDGSLLSNEQIAERLRTMGHSTANAAAVGVHKTQLRNGGFDVPYADGRKRGNSARSASDEKIWALHDQHLSERAIAKSLGVSQALVRRRLAEGRPEGFAAATKAERAGRYDLASREARAAWVENAAEINVRQAPIPGEADTSRQYGFALPSREPVVVQVKPMAGGLAEVDWFFPKRFLEDHGSDPFAAGEGGFSIAEKAALLARIVAIMEHDAGRFKRDGYKFFPASDGLGRTYQKLFRRFTQDDYTLVEQDGDLYLVRTGAELRDNGRLIRAADSAEPQPKWESIDADDAERLQAEYYQSLESLGARSADGRGVGRDPGDDAEGPRDTLSSRSISGRSTPDELVRVLAKVFGLKDIKALMDTARLQIVAQMSDISGGERLKQRLDAEGLPEPAALYSPLTGATYMIAGRIAPKAAVNIVLHEIGVHAGMKDMLGAGNWERLLNEVERLVEASPAGKRARELAENGTLSPEHVPEETLAYLVENSPDLPIVRRLLAQIRQWLWRTFGPNFGLNLTVDDIRMMAVASLRRQARIAEREAATARALEATEAQGVMASMARNAPAFFSALSRAVETSKTTKAPGAQWKATLAKTPGVKKEEIEWTGVNEWLDAQEGPVSRDALSDFLAQNGVQVQEVVKGDPSAISGEIQAKRLGLIEERDRLGQEANAILDGARERGGMTAAETERRAAITARLYAIDRELPLLQADYGTKSQTKWSPLVLAGAKEGSYRELLLTLPASAPEEALYEPVLRDGRWEITRYTDSSRSGAGPFADEAEAREAAARENARFPATRTNSADFKSSHWSEPNILAHIRFNERVDADGKRTLFIEEVQSDWHQTGRNSGYKGDLKADDFTIIDAGDGRWHVEDAKGNRVTVSGDSKEAAFNAARDDLERGAVPDAPFKDNKWAALALKRIVRYAAENGFEAVAWTPGDVQNKRHSLATIAKAIDWTKNKDGTFNIHAVPKERGERGASVTGKTAEELPAIVGRDMADRIVKGEGKQATDTITGGTKGSIKVTDDLEVGGEGMRAFYDRILPNIANDLGKKFGAKVGETTIDTEATNRRDPTYFTPIKQKVHTLPLTPDLKNQALDEGFPLFSMGSEDSRLSERQRQVLFLTDERAMTDREIAAEMNIPEERVRQIRWRALQMRDPVISAIQAARAKGETFPVLAQRGASAGLYGLSEDGDLLFSFGGQKAKTADKGALADAEQRIARGDDPEAVRKETGWFQGPDSLWRFEINDADARIGPGFADDALDAAEIKGRPLANVLWHKRLFEAYPGLRRLRVDWKRSDANNGAYLRAKDTIEVEAPSMKEALSILLHEVQHVIQTEEDFARGGSPSEFRQQEEARIAVRALSWRREMASLQKKSPDATPAELDAEVEALYRRMDMADWIPTAEERAIALDQEGNPDAPLEELLALYGLDQRTTALSPREMYRRLSGEIEARNVQKRQVMTDEERRETSPAATEDVPRKDAIVVMNGKVMKAAPANAPEPRQLSVDERDADPVRQTLADDPGMTIATERGIEPAEKALADAEAEEAGAKEIAAKAIPAAVSCAIQHGLGPGIRVPADIAAAAFARRMAGYSLGAIGGATAGNAIVTSDQTQRANFRAKRDAIDVPFNPDHDKRFPRVSVQDEQPAQIPLAITNPPEGDQGLRPVDYQGGARIEPADAPPEGSPIQPPPIVLADQSPDAPGIGGAEGP